MDVVGIDIGGSAIKAAPVGPDGLTGEVIEQPTPASADGVIETCTTLATRLGRPGIRGVGIGAAGLIEPTSGTIAWGPHLPESIPIAAALGASTGLPVFVDHDANVAALAESRLGAARGYGDALVVMLGTGIGGGIVIGGDVYRGRSFAGEIGHVVLDPNGPDCACGGRGCWETFISGTVLDRAAERILGRPNDVPFLGRDLVLAAEAGNQEAIWAIAEMATWLGRGVAELVKVLDPEVVVVGGAPSAVGELLLAPARLELDRLRHGPRSSPPLVASRFGRESAVIGAGLFALENLDD